MFHLTVDLISTLLGYTVHSSISLPTPIEIIPLIVIHISYAYHTTLLSVTLAFFSSSLRLFCATSFTFLVLRFCGWFFGFLICSPFLRSHFSHRGQSCSGSLDLFFSSVRMPSPLHLVLNKTPLAVFFLLPPLSSLSSPPMHDALRVPCAFAISSLSLI